jgi:DNA polymerase III delta' subunit
VKGDDTRALECVEVVPFLCRARARTLAHALLIEGPPGIGKSVAASQIAAALLCRGNDSARACGACPDCLQGSGHADLHVVGPAEDKRDIGVEQVRELAATLARTSVAGRARVAIVEPAERLTEQAQNALLKTLEEPGVATWLLLTTRRPEALLPTVRSRVQRVRLKRWPSEVLDAWLGERSPDLTADERAFAVRASEGVPGAAMQLLTDDEVKKIDVELGRWCSALGAGGRVPPPQDLVGAVFAGATGGVAAEDRARTVLLLLQRRLASALRGGLASAERDAYGPARIRSWADALEEVLDAQADLDVRIPAPQVVLRALLAVEARLGASSPVPIRVPHGPLAR